MTIVNTQTAQVGELVRIGGELGRVTRRQEVMGGLLVISAATLTTAADGEGSLLVECFES